MHLLLATRERQPSSHLRETMARWKAECESQFLRGDDNDDGQFNIADPCETTDSCAALEPCRGVPDLPRLRESHQLTIPTRRNACLLLVAVVRGSCSPPLYPSIVPAAWILTCGPF